MNTDRPALLKTTLALLHAIAPEVATQTLQLGRPLRQQVDLDSMDWLNFLISLHEHFGVTIAQSDYTQLITLNDVLDYLQARLK